MGFVHIQGMEEQLAGRILDNRNRYGPFTDLSDLIERISPGIEQLNMLIRVGSFRFTGKTKKELLWEANLQYKKNVVPSGSGFLFREKPHHFQLPALNHHPLDDALDEIELLGFPLCDVFSLVKENIRNFLPCSDLPNHLGKRVTVLGYLVNTKPVNT